MTARSSWSPRLCGSHHHAAPLDAPNALPAAPTAMCRATRCVTCASARTTTHGALCWSPIKLSRKRVGQCVHGRAGAKVLAHRYLRKGTCLHASHALDDRRHVLQVHLRGSHFTREAVESARPAFLDLRARTSAGAHALRISPSMPPYQSVRNLRGERTLRVPHGTDVADAWRKLVHG